MVGNAILIAGPTASGKSSLATALAERLGGVVVNTDSMQVYSVLDVLTARPTADEQESVQHELFGHVHPARAYSTGDWLRDVGALLATLPADVRPIFVGGTGLYFKALTEGLSNLPPVPGVIRDRLRERLRFEGPGPLHAELARRDASAAAALAPGDGQRIVRALELIETSGIPLADLLATRDPPLVDLRSTSAIVLEPDRSELHVRIGSRFDLMIEKGALDEVGTLLDFRLDPAMPAMKAIGVRELGAHLAGQLSLPEALLAAKAATRQYAKRQSTWFRNQLSPRWLRYDDAAAAARALGGR